MDVIEFVPPPTDLVPSVEKTDLLALVRHGESVKTDTPLAEVHRVFQSHQQDYCAVLEDGQVAGVCSMGHVGFLMGHRYGFAIYSQQPVREHMIARPVLIRRGTLVREVLDRSLGREGKEFNEDVVLIGQEDEYLGMIPVPSLVRLQSALVAERFHAQEILNRRLVTLSRQAGMAEVATGVLHNVGNVLNSVNVSASLVHDFVRKSKLSSLERVAKIMEEHRSDLGNYIQTDPKGKLIPELLEQLAVRMRGEQKEMLHELDRLVKHIHHIKHIVAMQQSYAKVSGISEVVAPAELVEDALQMNAEAFVRHGVHINREFGSVPKVLVDRHKVLQILTNLLRNAKYAMAHADGSDKRLTVAIHRASPDRVNISVTDNGIGIAAENLSRIFSHGFTTKKDGHGFGLHSAALAAREMGGALHAHSEGLGKGATFTLELVVDKSKKS